jgi:AcrR family transcriptional regulator
MSRGTEAELDRGSRRRLRTRAQLIDAARRLIAEQGGIDAVPIGEITEAADVAIGSFYNHFASREALFEAVLSDTLEAHGQRLDALSAEIADIAEFCSAGIRLTLRTVEADPIWGAFMVHAGIYIPEIKSILGQRLARTLLRGIESGRFTAGSEVTTLAVVAGGLLGAMRARLTQGLPDDADSLVAEQLLQLLGLPREEAAEIARRPLPESSEPPLRAEDSGAGGAPLRSRRAMA